jgi:ribonuclease P protein component
MSSLSALTLCKNERISGRTLVEKLFNGGSSHAMSAFPLRMVYMVTERKDDAIAKILISVPKRHFKRAVKRNRVKRQVREAFRNNKSILANVFAGRENESVAIAFIWLADELYNSNEVEHKVKNLLQRLSERICE